MRYTLMLVIAFVSVASAQAPTLTSDQKKDLLLAAKDVEIWQLKAQQALGELDKAKKALDQIIAASTPAGYQITEKLELVRLPQKDPAP